MLKITRFFDKLEDKIRKRLSRKPIIYAFIGGSGIIIFWRGVWHTIDYAMSAYVYSLPGPSDFIAELPWWDGPLSILVGSVILLLTGVFVSNFVGNEIIISGLKGEKRLAEKTEQEIKTDTEISLEIMEELKRVNDSMEKIQNYLEKK